MIYLDSHFTTCGVCQNEYEIDGEDNQELGGGNANGSSKKLRSSNKKSTSSRERHDDNHNNRDICQRLPLQSYLCGHVLCKACVANMYAAQVETSSKKVWLSCPFCNEPNAFHPRKRIIHTVTVQLIEWQRDMMNRQQSLTTTASSASRPEENKEQQHGHPSKTSPRSVASSSATTTDSSSLDFEESPGQSKKRAAATVGRSDTRGKYQRQEANSNDTIGMEQIERTTGDVSMTGTSNGHSFTESTMSNNNPTMLSANVESGGGVMASENSTAIIRKYGDRLLIARNISGKGIMRFGGNAVSIYPEPAADHENLEEIRSVLKGARVMCYSDRFQSHYAPQFAGQTFAALDWHPNDGREMAIFMRHSVGRSKGTVLGWEYCGNYIGAEKHEAVHIPSFESHKEVPDHRKKFICEQYIASTDEYGTYSFQDWHRKLNHNPSMVDLLPLDEQNMIQRAKQLGYHNQMNKKELFEKVLVNLNEFYKLKSIKFVRYDEDIYNYVKNGPTNKDKDGKIIKGRGRRRRPSALASDWYAILDQHSSHS